MHDLRDRLGSGESSAICLNTVSSLCPDVGGIYGAARVLLKRLRPDTVYTGGAGRTVGKAAGVVGDASWRNPLGVRGEAS